MPAGTVNNLHLHFTAEVFICLSGTGTSAGGWTEQTERHGSAQAT